MIKYAAHEHELSLFIMKTGSSILCKFCRKILSGEVYSCLGCLFFIHMKCAEFPQSLQHPVHQQHILRITSSGGRNKNCKSCWDETDGLAVSCGECDFNLHIGCALEIRRYLEEGESADLGSNFHKHQLKICHREGHKDSDFCRVCSKAIKGLGYQCKLLECSFQLHKWCAQLPTKMQHPFHPKHPLELQPVPPGGSQECSACRKEFVGYELSCVEDGFHLDSKCAFLVPTLKHPLHEHHLTLFEETRNFHCNVCGEVCKSEYYRCPMCNFNLHTDCLPLPSKVKHKDHVDQLTLYDRYLEDDSGEYYCDLCVQRRHADHGAYCCLPCKLYAHIHCALSWEKLKITDHLAIDGAADEITCLQKELKEMKMTREEVEHRYQELLKKLKDAKKRHSKLLS
ncbi:hypothetical protein MLD38_009330 [Melastoma candidum]|uniref:Uncharacterized protein n=1 Tax=Melastoma candidum TaxID=119954 RepID=A0ACB9S5Q4_9MYRT|nr:hypothetical protein MLD38_009330 [Melastoma candidum]